MRKRTRRILIVVLVLGVLGAGAAGAFFALRRGQQSQNPFERGLRAERSGNFAGAERRYRDLLETKPNHPQAFRRLVWVLGKQGKYVEIEEAAKLRCSAAPNLADGWVTRVDMAMRSGRFGEAERVARSRASSNPLLLQSTLWRIQDVSDDPRRRLAAAESALRYAQLADNAESRAIAELFAARTYLDLAELSSEKETVEELRERAGRLQRDGAARLARSTQTRPNEFASLLLSRFRLLDPWADARREAEADLSLWLQSNLESAQAGEIRRDLIRYRLDASKELPPSAEAKTPGESHDAYLAIALELARPMVDYPAYRLFRLLRSFERAGANAEALQLISARKQPEKNDLVELERYRLLLKTEREPPEAVASQALELLKRSTDWRVAVVAHDIARAAGQPEAALEALKAHQRDRPAPQLALTLANRLTQEGSRTDEAIRLVEDSFGTGAEPAMLGSVLAVLHRAGPEHVMGFLERRITTPGDEELRYRLMRVLYIAGQIQAENGTEADEPQLRTIARQDLARCLELPDQASPQTWMTAARFALAFKEYGIAGRCSARLIRTLESGLGRSLSVFSAAARATDPAVRQRFLDELMAGIRGTPDAEWVVPLSEAVRGGETTLAKVIDAILEAVGVEQANARTLDLIAPLAMAASRSELAERAARRLLEETPDHQVAAAVLGSVLFAGKNYQEVLDLHDRPGTDAASLPPIAHDQCIRALIALDRVSDAVERAQRYLDANLRQLRAYLVLANAMLADGKKEEALGVLTSAPQSDDVQMRRATLLLNLKRPAPAEQIAWDICRRRPHAVPAWSLLLRILSAQKRTADLLLPITAALKSPAVANNPALSAALLEMRGMANEQASRASAAIDDYRASLERGGRSIVSLNNAAWLIHETDRSKIELAREYIELALEASPRNASVNDTAAHIYLTLEEFDRAVDCIAVACDVAPDNWGYRLTRARALAAKGARSEALAVLDEVLAAKPPTPVAQKAKDLRGKIESAAVPD